MARPLNRLSALKVARAKKPGMLADGGSLYLRIAPGGSRQWIFRYVINGRLRDMSIGPAHTLTLAEARERATEARKLRLDGIDPIDHKRAHGRPTGCRRTHNHVQGMLRGVSQES
jgi:Arm DNA-binding domain